MQPRVVPGVAYSSVRPLKRRVAILKCWWCGEPERGQEGQARPGLKAPRKSSETPRCEVTRQEETFPREPLLRTPAARVARRPANIGSGCNPVPPFGFQKALDRGRRFTLKRLRH